MIGCVFRDDLGGFAVLNIRMKVGLAVVHLMLWCAHTVFPIGFHNFRVCRLDSSCPWEQKCLVYRWEDLLFESLWLCVYIPLSTPNLN